MNSVKNCEHLNIDQARNMFNHLIDL